MRGETGVVPMPKVTATAEWGLKIEPEEKTDGNAIATG